MRQLSILAAAVCLIPTSAARAQTRYSAGHVATHPYSCVTERPIARTAVPFNHFSSPPRQTFPAVPIPAVAPTLVRRANSHMQPVFPARPAQPNYYFGRGILGQPKVYVPGQPLRNWLRWLTL